MKEISLTVNKELDFECLLTETEEEQSKGLMFKKWKPPVMVFTYDKPKINTFWMKNTPSPLDIVFCLKGKIIKILEGVPFSTQLIGGNFLSDMIIEFPKGTCEDNNISEGSEVELKK
jgi:uncharacterized protein